MENFTPHNPGQPVSQTGAAAAPIQVENVQYNVQADGYESKPGLIFQIAAVCVAGAMFFLAVVLHTLTGAVLGFSEDVAGTLQLSISILIPLGIVGFIAVRRMDRLFAQHPEALEEIKFKTKLRRTFLLFLALAVLGSVVAIFNFIEMFTSFDEDTIENQFFALYFVGGLILMSLWLYRYQKLTTR